MGRDLKEANLLRKCIGFKNFVASHSPVGTIKLSSIFPHFPMVPLILLKFSSFSFSIWSEGLGYTTVRNMKYYKLHCTLTLKA